jgi:hypothetical protein
MAIVNTLAEGGVSSILLQAKPLLLYILGIVVYSLIVFKLYRFVAHRDILKLDLHTYDHGFRGFLEKLKKFLYYVIEHIFLVPVIIFLWFAFLSLSLFMLGSNSPDQVLIVSMALVGSIRVTSYFSEDLSRDLSKMLPFALLAVFMIDTSLLQPAEIVDRLQILLGYPAEILSYLVFVVIIELVMRIIFEFLRVFFKEFMPRKL